MPLPSGDVEWPPPQVAKARAKYREWGAWYSGDVDELTRVYEGALGFDLKPVAAQSGLGVHMKQRMFWGSAPPASQLRLHKLHMPLAGDIAATSADLLFGEPIKLPVPGSKPTQARLEHLLDDGGAGAALLEGGEVCAAYGDVYLRAGWDKTVADHVLVDAISPDFAVPEWRSGRLAAVTFWRELSDDRGEVWRHLERHEVVGDVGSAGRQGVILHGLYLGKGDKLGERRPLNERPETEPFAALADKEGRIVTGARRLSVVYVPNMRPNRARIGSPLGRSDFAGIEPVFDSLDEVWTSWLRDVRIGKGRLVIPDTYLQSQGRGQGSVYDPEQEVYQTVDALTGGEGIAMQVVQFAIRVAEHQETAQALMSQALRSAGYSVQTFGEDQASVAATATEIRARRSRSFQTRARKIGYWKPQLAQFFAAVVEIDVAQFGPDGVEAGAVPNVAFPDGVTESQEEVARSVQMFHAAEAVSLYTRVKMTHPEWEEPDVLLEVDRIREDQRLSMPDIGGPAPSAGSGAGSSDGGRVGAPAGPAGSAGTGAGPGDDEPEAKPAGSARAARAPRRPVNARR